MTYYSRSRFCYLIISEKIRDEREKKQEREKSAEYSYKNTKHTINADMSHIILQHGMAFVWMKQISVLSIFLYLRAFGAFVISVYVQIVVGR